MKALLVILLALAFIFGWTALVWAIYNAVAVALGLPVLTFWVVFGLQFLLGVVGSAFRSAGGKAS